MINVQQGPAVDEDLYIYTYIYTYIYIYKNIYI